MEKRPIYADEKAVAQMTGISVKTLQSWRWQRRGIPYIKCGKLVRYNLSDVTAYLEAHRVEVEEVR